VRLWEVATGREIATLRGHENYVWSVAFSPDGHTLVSGSSDNSIFLWDVADQREIGVVRGRAGAVFGGAVTSVAFSPDGRTLATASALGRPRLWPFGQGLLDGACAHLDGLPFSDNDRRRFGTQSEWCTSDTAHHLRLSQGSDAR
jgi:WD40 repeat protein